MSRLAARLQETWYGGREPGWVLRGLSALYGFVVRLRRSAFRYGWLSVQRIGAPVIVVGNLTVGGSGKTPMVIALVEHLRAQGWKPGVVSRGYGRRSKGQRVVDADSSAAEAGDEPLLIARRCGVPVVVDVDRVAAARRVVALGCNIVVADDGLQHYRLYRDLEIEVCEVDRRYGNARLLPAGPLREPLALPSESPRLHITNGIDTKARPSPASPECHFLLVGDMLVGSQGRTQLLNEWRGRRVHAVAGIGHPERFFQALRDYSLELVEHPFADHHAYRPEDLRFTEKLPIVMTEKDWVKCAAFAPADCWMLPVRAECSDGFFAAVTKLLTHIGAHSG